MFVRPRSFSFTFHKKVFFNEIVYFSKLYCHTSFKDPTLNYANVAPTSQIRASAILLLLKLNSVAFSPQANYTDRAAAACRRS
jgi:hypothetical protein